LRDEALDPGKNHDPVECLVVDCREKRTKFQLLLFAQAIDNTLVAALLHDFIQAIQNDALLVHYQDHHFHKSFTTRQKRVRALG
jgi:hypothetical protein